jgi:hypothetical protein
VTGNNIGDFDQYWHTYRHTSDVQLTEDHRQSSLVSQVARLPAAVMISKLFVPGVE